MTFGTNSKIEETKKIDLKKAICVIKFNTGRTKRHFNTGFREYKRFYKQ